jgi:hypothetical protein
MEFGILQMGVKFVRADGRIWVKQDTCGQYTHVPDSNANSLDPNGTTHKYEWLAFDELVTPVQEDS